MPTPTTYNTQYELYNVDFKRGDVRHFTSEARRSEYFDESHLIDSGTLNSYIRVDQDFKIDKTYADIREANYCRYNNGDGDGWRYAYITRMEVVSTSCTRLYIQQDPWQNNMFNFEIHGTRLRGHVDRIVKTGNNMYRRWSFTPEPISANAEIEAVNYLTTNYQLMVYVLSEPLSGDNSTTSSIFEDGVYYYFIPCDINLNGAIHVTLDGGDVIDTSLDAVCEELNSSGYIVNKFITSTPPMGVSIGFTRPANYTITTSSTAVVETVQVNHNGQAYYVWRYNVQRNNLTLPSGNGIGIPNYSFLSGSYSPRGVRSQELETKIYQYPYRYAAIGVGNTKKEIRYELLPNSTDSVYEASYYVIFSGGSGSIMLKAPNGYNKADDRINPREVLTSSQGAVRRDVENTYLAANNDKLNIQTFSSVLVALGSLIAGFATGGIGWFVGAGVGATSAIANNVSTRVSIANAADSISLNGTPALVSLSSSQNPHRISYCVKDDELEALYSYFYTYGYTINEWQNIPNTQIRTRYYFDYYLFGDDVHCDVQDSSTARELMEEDLRKGVTFWHWNETTNGFQHTRENLEMSLITN